MTKWLENTKAHAVCGAYLVVGWELCETAWYGDDGTADFPSTLPLGKYRLGVYNWETDRYGRSVAGDATSRIQMVADFNSKEAANKTWLELTTKDMSVEDVLNLGFRRR